MERRAWIVNKKYIDQTTDKKTGGLMKVSNFLGTRVLDKNAFEIGKVVDMFIEPEKGIINSIIVSTGEFGLKKKDLMVKTGEIGSVGDYILLNIEKSQVEMVEETGETSSKSRVKLEKSD